ncbi:FecR domain-containing protein [Marinobacter litoralis]|uniref:FecR domain-containing protein n=1 Tax=Marinobacter litoralis TaxID=187981 RepID=UPI0018EB499B|nr:FecR domain-containing protein [Marinobacter litoralis]MBJ6138854.1 FecR domain-containing protein [Marinobacter litoralis]
MLESIRFTLRKFSTYLFGLAIALMPGLALAEWSITQGSASASSYSAETRSEWIYTLQNKDSLASIAESLLQNSGDGHRLLAHNGLPGNTHLKAGQSLRIPVAWLKRQPEPAKVSSVSGNVQHISGADGRKTSLTEQSLIRVGDELLLGAGSATLTLADGSEIRVSPNSRLMFNRLTQYGKTGMVDTRLRLHRGEVHSRVKALQDTGSRFQITTPSAVVAVRGTAFTLQTNSNGSSIQVQQGAVDFGRPGKSQRIPTGYGASVSTSGPEHLRIRKLPPAPEMDPVEPLVSQLPKELTWLPSPASAHRIDIFETASGGWVQSRSVTGNQFPIDQLDNGQYEVHVAALDQRGIAGLPSVIPIEVELQAKTPELISPENGASVDDDMPEFRWQLNGANEIARIEVSQDDSFENLVSTSEWAPESRALPSRALSPGTYFWRVTTEAGGTSFAASEPRKLTINGTLPPVRIININYLDSQVRVFWEQADSAKKYRLQLSEEPGFQNIIKEADVPDTAASLRLIPGRRYFVRVKAVADGPIASRWGPGRELYLD